MNRRDKRALFEGLCWDILTYIRLYPRSVTRDILLAMLDKNPVYAILVFASKTSVDIDIGILSRIVSAKSKGAAKKLLNGSFGSSLTQKAYLPTLMSRAKKFLADHGEVIYGSGMFGQVHADDMTVQDAAMWLAPRLAQMRNERRGYEDSVNLLKSSGRFKEDVDIVDRFTRLIRAPKMAEAAHEGVGLFFRRR